jgi:hypothetical protein
VDGGETKGFVQQVTVAAGQKLFVTNLIASPVAGLAGSHSIFMIPSTTGAEIPKWFADTAANEVEITFTPTGRLMPQASDAYSWSGEGLQHLKAGSVTPGGAVRTYFVLNNVLAGWVHWAQVRAIDKSGNRSGVGTAVKITSAADNNAPGIPANLTAAPGYNLVGLTWSRSDAPDLDRYQVRYRAVGDTDWIGPQNIYANFCIIHDLDLKDVVGNLSQYEFAVRAVDRSGNVEKTPAAPGVAQVIDNLSNPAILVNTGWSASVIVEMSAIPAEAIAVEELFANYAYLINVTADQITTGHFNVTPGVNDPSSIIVWNDTAQTIMAGYWSPSGWYLIDPKNRNLAIRGKAGVIAFTQTAWFPGNPAGNGQVWQTPETNWTTAIGPNGITADLIQTGSFAGGHNRILNSGFELRPRSTTGTQVFDTAAEWDATIGAATNKNTGSATYVQAKYQYVDV